MNSRAAAGGQALRSRCRADLGNRRQAGLNLHPFKQAADLLELRPDLTRENASHLFGLNLDERLGSGDLDLWKDCLPASTPAWSGCCYGEPWLKQPELQTEGT